MLDNVFEQYKDKLLKWYYFDRPNDWKLIVQFVFLLKISDAFNPDFVRKSTLGFELSYQAP